MQARTVTFYISTEMVSRVLEIIDNEVLPEYRQQRSFVGLVVLERKYGRSEVLGLSVWDGDEPDCGERLGAFRRQVAELEGTSPATEVFDVLRLVTGMTSSEE